MEFSWSSKIEFHRNSSMIPQFSEFLRKNFSLSEFSRKAHRILKRNFSWSSEIEFHMNAKIFPLMNSVKVLIKNSYGNLFEFLLRIPREFSTRIPMEGINDSRTEVQFGKFFGRPIEFSKGISHEVPKLNSTGIPLWFRSFRNSYGKNFPTG